jgi:hypothetical protein
MKTIKITVIVLLALLVVAYTGSYLYLGSSDRKIPPEISSYLIVYHDFPIR